MFGLFITQMRFFGPRPSTSILDSSVRENLARGVLSRATALSGKTTSSFTRHALLLVVRTGPVYCWRTDGGGADGGGGHKKFFTLDIGSHQQ